jgi:uncharacterized protein YndB with AHSA1/START domain
MNTDITIETTVKCDTQAVWSLWTEPEHIKHWMRASSDWECAEAINDVKVGGHYIYTLQARDKSASFDVPGTYTKIGKNSYLASTLADGREVIVSFTPVPSGTHIVQTFEIEHENSPEKQQEGWQAMLDSFKAYAESIRIAA